MLMYRELLRIYTSDSIAIDLITAVTFLGTPTWSYGRSLFVEPYLIFFTVTAYALGFRNKLPLVCGLLIGLGVMMKPPYLLVLAPLAVLYLFQKRWLQLVFLGVGPVIATAFVLYLNNKLYGSPFRAPQPWAFSTPLEGIFGIFFSFRNGLLPFAPAIILALFGWPIFWHQHRNEALCLIAACLSYFLLVACWKIWWGGYCYGPRLLMPVVPLLFVGMVAVPQMKLWKTIWFPCIAILLCLVSVLINFLGAIPYWSNWGTHPLFN